MTKKLAVKKQKKNSKTTMSYSCRLQSFMKSPRTLRKNIQLFKKYPSFIYFLCGSSAFKLAVKKQKKNSKTTMSSSCRLSSFMKSLRTLREKIQLFKT
jgi:hypothetical protein